jgi:hypothetical protein
MPLKRDRFPIPNGHQKTTVQALRMSAEVHNALMEEAKRQSLSLASLMNRLLQDYVTFGRYAERHGIMRMSPTILVVFLNELSDETAEKVGRLMGKEHPREMLMSLGLPFTLQNARRLIGEYLARFAHWFEPELIDDGLAILLRHHLNRKWSVFLTGYVTAMFEDLGFRLTETNLTEYSTSVRFVQEKT